MGVQEINIICLPWYALGQRWFFTPKRGRTGSFVLLYLFCGGFGWSICYIPKVYNFTEWMSGKRTDNCNSIISTWKITNFWTKIVPHYPSTSIDWLLYLKELQKWISIIQFLQFHAQFWAILVAHSVLGASKIFIHVTWITRMQGFWAIFLCATSTELCRIYL